jgi:hypothetical protein
MILHTENHKRAEGMAQVVKHLPEFSPRAAKQKQKQKQKHKNSQKKLLELEFY